MRSKPTTQHHASEDIMLHTSAEPTILSICSQSKLINISPELKIRSGTHGLEVVRQTATTVRNLHGNVTTMSSENSTSTDLRHGCLLGALPCSYLSISNGSHRNKVLLLINIVLIVRIRLKPGIRWTCMAPRTAATGLSRSMSGLLLGMDILLGVGGSLSACN